MSNSISSARILLFLWQIGMVDTLSALQILYNAGYQYTAIVAAELFSQSTYGSFKPKAILLPITGLKTCADYVVATLNVAIRRHKYVVI